MQEMISIFIWVVANFKMYLINNVLSLSSLYNFGWSVKVVFYANPAVIKAHIHVQG